MSKEQLADCTVFTVHRERKRAGDREGTFYVLEGGDWVNIIPLTTDGDVVMIEQYRHGSEEVTLEIPGGMVDAGEQPLAAARREMREETGFDSPDIEFLGRNAPNPAILRNHCYSFLAEDVEFFSPPSLDGNESIRTRLVPLRDIDGMIADGSITHALTIVAFYFFRLRGQSSKGM